MTASHLTRRQFVTTAAAACAAPLVIRASALGAEGKPAPSERITVGMIGVGRQAKYYNLKQFLQMPDVQVVAVCDVDAWRLDNCGPTLTSCRRPNWSATAGLARSTP
jgi:hypothetical protein